MRWTTDPTPPTMTDRTHPDADRWRELAPLDPGSDPSRDFWGDAADWRSEPVTESTGTDLHGADAHGGEVASGLGAAARRWWNSTGRTATRTHAVATRSHFAPTAPRTAPMRSASDERPFDIEESAPWLDAGDTADAADCGASGAWDDGWEQPVDRPRGGVDPLLARFGGLAVVLTLLVPVVMSFTSDSDGGDALRSADAPSVLSAPTPANPAPGAPVAVDTAAPLTAAPIAEPQPDADTATSAPAAAPSAAPEAPVTEPVEPPATTAVASPQSEPLTDARCGSDYEIVAGDFWIRIADGAGVAIADLFAVNDATSDTPLFPGRTICLPVGASTPTPPTSPPPTTPATTSAPSTASPSRSSGTTTTATTPRTTPAPTTTVAPPALPPASNATADEVQAIIRAVWPDDLEERALEIARRESKYLRDREEQLLLRGLPDLLERPSQLARRSRRHVLRAALRPDDQRSRGTDALRAGRWLGPLGRLKLPPSGRRQRGEVPPTLSPVTNQRS